MTETNHTEVLRKVIHWAESRCPCKEETPDPCTLCGATVAEGTCKAVESIFPRDLLRDLRDVLSARASAGEGVVWVDPEQLTAWFANPAMNRLHPQPQQTKKYSLALTAAPQSAQAGASGGGDGRLTACIEGIALAKMALMAGDPVKAHECLNAISDKLDTFTTPASPATGGDPCIECGADPGEACFPNCCTQTPKSAAAQGVDCKCALCDALNMPPESRRRVHDLIAKHPELFPPIPATIAAAPQPQQASARCDTCDGTGSVHRADGEYIGECNCTIPPAHGDGEVLGFLRKFDADFIARKQHGQCQVIIYQERPRKDAVPLYTAPRPAPEAQGCRDPSVMLSSTCNSQ